MKIKPDHYAHLEAALRAVVVAAGPERLAAHKSAIAADPRVKDAAMRFRWDLFHAARLTDWTCSALYPYLNDSHIDTALRHFCQQEGI